MRHSAGTVDTPWPPATSPTLQVGGPTSGWAACVSSACHRCSEAMTAARAVDGVAAVVGRPEWAADPVHDDVEVGVAARGDDRLEVGRLGDDARRVRPRCRHATYRRMPSAVLLLVDEGGQLAPGRRAPPPAERRHGDDARGEAALHVGAAPAVDPSVADLAAERVNGPAVADGHDVGVPEQEQARPVAARE